jgi:hypothetical protein
MVASSDPNPQFFPQETGCSFTAPLALDAAQTMCCTSATQLGNNTPEQYLRFPHNDATLPPSLSQRETSLSKTFFG